MAEQQDLWASLMADANTTPKRMEPKAPAPKPRTFGRSRSYDKAATRYAKSHSSPRAPNFKTKGLGEKQREALHRIRKRVEKMGLNEQMLVVWCVVNNMEAAGRDARKLAQGYEVQHLSRSVEETKEAKERLLLAADAIQDALRSVQSAQMVARHIGKLAGKGD